MAVDLGAGALLSLIPIAVLAGVAILLVFRRWTDRDALERVTAQMIARVMEFRLFIDEPALVFRSQRALFRLNGRMLVLLARPLAIMAVASLLLFPQLEALYGRAALQPGSAAIVNAQVRAPGETPLTLSAPADVRVETPGVHVLRAGEISWRVRPLRAVSSRVAVAGPDGMVFKRIASGPGVHYLSETRAGSWPAFLLHPCERPFRDSNIRSIAILYPPATILGANWMIWFFGFSTLGALLAHFARS